MKEWADGDIDKALREAAGNFTPKYNPAAWAQMQSAMQAEGLIAPVQSPLMVILKYLGIGILLLLLLGSGVYYYQQGLSRVDDLEIVVENEQPDLKIRTSQQSDANDAKQNISGITLTSGEDSDKQAANSVITKVPENIATISSKNEVSNDEKGNDTIVLQNASIAKTNETKDDVVFKVSAQLTDEPGQNPNESNNHENTLVSTSLVNDTETINDESLNEKDRVLSQKDSPVDRSTIVNEPPIEISILEVVENSEKNWQIININAVESKDDDSIFVTPILFSPEYVLIPVSDQDQEGIEGEFNRWSASVIFSPDFSGASIGKLKGTGIDVGLIVEYFISKNLSINSGAIYSTKKYFVDEGFDGYASRWPGRDLPDEIDATCSVIDIPINLKYYLRNNSGTRIFLSAGMSSYFMLSEDYTYLYDNSYNGQDWAVSLTNENTHYFGLMNFSFGIQKEIRNGLYITGEPYYKTPITGIGAGGVSLKSTGFIISLKKDF